METPPERVQSTATGELLAKLKTSPKLDGERFGLEGELGQGGMGVVMRIYDRLLNRRLAMKVLLERCPPRDEEEVKLRQQMIGRFLEEAQVTSQLDHPGVVPVHELGLDATGKVYFTMRMVKGRTASEVFADAVVERNGWSLTRALEVVLKVCDTMSYAHEKGVLHRDLKPNNIMVGRFGEVYVMDWGLAKVVSQADRHDLRIYTDQGTGISRLETARKRDADHGATGSIVTMDGQQLGTPSYMSPEQARSDDPDERTDVYAVGAMLYELVTGSPPYAPGGMRKPAYRILEDLLIGPPRPIADFAKKIPRDLRIVIERAMARDRDERYAGMAELATALRAALAKPFRMWVRRNKFLAVIIGLFLLSIFSGAVGVFMQYLRAENAAEEARTERLAAIANAERAVASEQEALRRAEENARLAQEKSILALAEARAKAEAQRTVSNFNQISAIVRLKEALLQQDQLWPAWPEQAAALQAWLEEDCAQLLSQRPQIDATIMELRNRALPWTAEQVDADRRAAAEWPLFERQQQRVDSLRRAQAIRSGIVKLELPELPPALQNADASALNSFAWPRVAPEAAEGEKLERTVFGEEALALVAARAAVAKSSGQDGEHQFLDTLAWAALANGQDEEAKQRTAEALAMAPTKDREAYLGYQRAIEAAIVELPVRIATAEAKLAELERAVSVRRTWTFGGDEESRSAEFLHNALVDVLAGLNSMEAKERADVAQRLSWAQQVENASITAHRERWSEARRAIMRADDETASVLYRDAQIDLPPQMGLVPIGMNPVTKLWEFYDLRSAWDGESDPTSIEIPTHLADGSIEVKDGTGIVFVLLPGGRVTLGSQKDDPEAPYYDPQRQNDETLHEVTLSPFFLARHEVTQGQWSRLWTWDAELRDPSNYKAGQNVFGKRITLANPVEQVDWMMCDHLLTRYGLVLPTEAQWEYGCRGGTTTVWNVNSGQLQKVANLADASAKAAVPQWGNFESWRDGHVVHAPVGTFAANAFGLYDVHGNVWEWCRDWFGDYGSERVGDGLRSGSSSRSRVYRGGSYLNAATNARSAVRSSYAPSFRNNGLGLRPSRIITF